jgi:hypothetical protein
MGAVLRAAVAAVVVSLAIPALVGCTGGEPPAVAVIASPAASLGPTMSATGPAVPGGAPVVVPPGAPPICVALASSAAIRAIPDAVAAMTGTGSDTGASALRAAASDMRVLAAQDSTTVAVRLRAAADALDRLAAGGIADSEAVAKAVSALSDLGEEVQTLCQFPVGSPAPSAS